MSKSAAVAAVLSPEDTEAAESKLVEEVSAIVSAKTGVQLTAKHVAMVQSRLVKRRQVLGNLDAQAYLRYVHENRESETPHLVALLTTHHTYFFREFSQFEFLEEKVLPQLIAAVKASGGDTIRVLSAACSRGHEVYSLAMFLRQVLPELAPGFKFAITGTDVDAESVKVAAGGVYRWDEIKEAPAAYVQDCWTRGTGDIEDFVKAKPALRSLCTFKQGNLLDMEPALGSESFHLIFCRNVFIYFTSEQVKQSTMQLFKHLDPAGVLLLGLSESLNGLDTGASLIGPSAYAHPKRPKASAPAAGDKPRLAAVPTPPPAAAAAPIRVLCVDDSATVLMLLKKILSRESGFEVVSTAKDGNDAAEQLKTLKVDLVTLDIHMPNLGGIEYLEKYFKPGHPAVVMVSSVSREDPALAQRALQLGASDYVEKPTMESIGTKGDEIRTKLKAICRLGDRKADLELETKPAKLAEIDPETHAKLVFWDGGDVAALKAILAQPNSCARVPIVIITPNTVAAGTAAREGKAQRLPKFSGKAEWRAGGVFAADVTEAQPHVWNEMLRRKWTVMVPGKLIEGFSFDESYRFFFKSKDRVTLIVNEASRESITTLVGLTPVHRMPLTSFMYHADDFLRRGAKS